MGRISNLNIKKIDIKTLKLLFVTFALIFLTFGCQTDHTQDVPIEVGKDQKVKIGQDSILVKVTEEINQSFNQALLIDVMNLGSKIIKGQCLIISAMSKQGEIFVLAMFSDNLLDAQRGFNNMMARYDKTHTLINPKKYSYYLGSNQSKKILYSVGVLRPDYRVKKIIVKTHSILDELTTEELMQYTVNTKKDTTVGFTTLPSGLKYKINKKGNGRSPTRADKVKVYYKAYTLDGYVFFESENAPEIYHLYSVIEGWQEALPLMSVGSKWTVIIPPDLGYGKEGTDTIPPNTTLVYDIELIGIE